MLHHCTDARGHSAANTRAALGANQANASSPGFPPPGPDEHAEQGVTESWTDTQTPCAYPPWLLSNEGEDKLKEFVREREKRKTVLIKAADKTPVKTHEQNKRSRFPPVAWLAGQPSAAAGRSVQGTRVLSRGLPCTMLAFMNK